MSNPAEITEIRKTELWLVLVLVGPLISVQGLIAVVLQTAEPTAEVGVIPWLVIIVGLLVAAVGYLQKIAAKS